MKTTQQKIKELRDRRRALLAEEIRLIAELPPKPESVDDFDNFDAYNSAFEAWKQSRRDASPRIHALVRESYLLSLEIAKLLAMK